MKVHKLRDGTELHVLEKAEDVSDHVLVLAANCVEDWYPDFTWHDTLEFIDRLCRDYLNSEGIEIEDLDTPAVRKIMARAREARRDLA